MDTVERWRGAPVAALRERFLEQNRAVPRGLLELLDADPRAGARAVAHSIRSRQARNRAEGQRLRNMLRFESELWEKGFTRIAGVDEAGMGPLAGPVVAAAVVLPPDYRLRGLDDSKKILDAARREAMAADLRENALAWAVGCSEVEEIDHINIHHAGLQAMRRAVEGLGDGAADHLLVDARTVPSCAIPQKGFKHGDALSLSIAAASIIAKTTRDALMVELDALYPGYGLAEHKGYPTPVHCEALERLGASPIHRRSFERVREVLSRGEPPAQGRLFG